MTNSIKWCPLSTIFQRCRSILAFTILCTKTVAERKILYRIHNSQLSSHLGLNKTLIEFRKRVYFPGFTELLPNYVKNWSTRIQTKNEQSRALSPPMESITSDQTFPGDMMQIDLVGHFNSPVYKYAPTAFDVFAKYLFAVPLSSIRAENIAKAFLSFFLKHSYIPRTILADIGTGFSSKILHELTKLLEIRLKHASLKHPQTIGVIERAHSAFKRFLKVNSSSAWSNWQKYVDVATFVHNTSFQDSIGTRPSSISHGREQFKPIDFQFGKTLSKSEVTNDYVNDLEDTSLTQFDEINSRIVNAYHKYRTYYDFERKKTRILLASRSSTNKSIHDCLKKFPNIDTAV